MSRLPWRAVRAAGASLLLGLAITAQPAGAGVTVAPDCQLESGPARAVVQVLDGETVKLDDGREARLVGALAPRGADVGRADADWAPAAAARQALAALVQDRSVTLAFGGRRTDRYGRWLAHLIVAGNGGEQWVQAALLEQGMARAYSDADNARCITRLIAHERVARHAGRGLWANAAYQVRAAEQPRELAAYRGTFQLVAGRISRLSRHRNQVRLRFGRAGSRLFSVVVQGAALEQLAGLEPRRLEGLTAIVRGWIEGRTLPLIEIGAAGQLELSEPASVSGPTSSLHRFEPRPNDRAAADEPPRSRAR